MIITIGRTCGSDGYTVGQRLSEIYGLPLYDKKKLITIAKEKGIYSRMPNFFSEHPVNSLLFAIAEGEGETNLSGIPVQALQEIIGEKACIIIGRAANYVFKNRQDACRVFLYGDKAHRINRMMTYNNLTKKKAEELIEETDHNREIFHQYYTGEVWGKAENYDMCLDSGRLGVEGVVNMIQEYIKVLNLA